MPAGTEGVVVVCVGMHLSPSTRAQCTEMIDGYVATPQQGKNAAVTAAAAKRQAKASAVLASGGGSNGDTPGNGPPAVRVPVFAVEVSIAAATGVSNAGTSLADIGTRAGRALATEHSSEAARVLGRLAHDTLGRDVGRLFRGDAVRLAGRVLGAAGLLFTAYDEFSEEGNNPLTAVLEAGFSVGAGVLGGVATAAICATGIGTVGCLAAGVGIAVVSTPVADFVGEYVVGSVVDVGSTVIGGIGDVFGSLFGP